MKDVEPPLVADCEPSRLVEPCEAAFDHPPMAAEFLTGLDATSGDAGLDLAVQARSAPTPVIVGFVGVQLVRPTAWRPRFPATEGTALSRSSNGTLSCTLAPVRRNASRMPRRSVIRCRLVPSLPRSVGFGPVAAPPF